MACCLVISSFLFLAFFHGMDAHFYDWNDPQTEDLLVSMSTASQMSTRLAITLYKQLGEGNQRNVIFAPWSAYLPLGIVLRAIEGPTKEKIKKVLGVPLGQEVYASISDTLTNIRTYYANKVNFRPGNSFFYNGSKLTLSEDFNEIVRYDFGILPMTFNASNAEANVNYRVWTQTGEKIGDTLSPGDITPETDIVLVSAQFFEGTFELHFDEQLTRERDFETGSGDVVRTPMMTRTGNYSVKYVENLQAKTLHLPYGDDGKFSLYLLMPYVPEEGLGFMESHLSSKALEEALTDMPPPLGTEVIVPKFTMRAKLLLNDLLTNLGLGTIFTGDMFYTLTGSPAGIGLKFDKIYHDAIIQVNERGPRKGATYLVKPKPFREPVVEDFVANSSFLFVLRGNPEKVNYLIGRVTDPTIQVKVSELDH